MNTHLCAVFLNSLFTFANDFLQLQRQRKEVNILTREIKNDFLHWSHKQHQNKEDFTDQTREMTYIWVTRNRHWGRWESMQFYSLIQCFMLVHQVTTWKYDTRCVRANMQSTSLGLICTTHTEVFCCHHRGQGWLEQTQKCQVTLHKWTTLRGWLRLQRCKHMTDEKQTRVASSAALPHLHTGPYLQLVASVLDAALKVAIIWHLNANTDIWTHRITILSAQCPTMITCSTILQHYRILANKTLTYRRSYLQKFLFVHMLIAVNIKHFESYVKSCTRLCNGNALSVIWTLCEYYRKPHMNLG